MEHFKRVLELNGHEKEKPKNSGSSIRVLVDRLLAVRSTGLSGRSTGDTVTVDCKFRIFQFQVFFVCPIFPALFGTLFVCFVWLYEILTCRLSCPLHMAHKSFYFLYMVVGLFEAKCKGHHGFLGFP